MSALRLDGRVAVVTGGGRGIGLAVTDALAAQGCSVVICSRSENVELAAAKSDEHGVRVVAVQADVRDAKAVNAIYRTVHAEFGRLDVLVNNAGVLGDSLLGMIGDELIQQTIAVNLTATILNMQAASKLMRRTGAGSIVNISSIIGLRGNVGQVVYAASKAGVVGATLAAAKELAPAKIRVNAIAPGYIATDMIAHLPRHIHEERIAGIPFGRPGTAAEVASAVLFLASDLSAYVTGQTLGVDGGMVI